MIKKLLVLLLILVVVDLSAQHRVRIPGLRVTVLEANELPNGTPTVSSCGIAPSVAGTNSNGAITVGAGVVTSCVLTFSQTLSAVPVCIPAASLALAMGTSAASTSAVTFAVISKLGSGTIYYHCRAS
jgi:hypothetical protein